MTKPWMKLLLTPVALAAAWPVAAQSDASAGNGLQTIEVTASKRKQLVLDVPYSVTAISAAEIRDRGVLDIRDMQSTVPSLFITDNGPGQSRIQLRGMSTIAGLPTVGQYLDEMTINLDQVQRALDIPLVDMARIEVLRGPQGTLYGDGSLGGTIKFITRNPRLDATEFSAEAGMRRLSGGQTGYFANAVANLPLAKDTAGLRIVAGYEKSPGWVDNSTTGAKDINGGDRQYIRAKGLAKLGASSDVSVLLYHYRLSQDNGSFSRADGSIPVAIAAPSDDEVTMASVLLNVDVGFATLTSATGWIDRSLLQQADVTGFFGPRLPPSLLPPGAGIALRTDMRFKIISEELRLASNDNGPLTWLAGLYFRKSDSTQTRTTPVTSATPVGILNQTGTSPADTQQQAVFGEVSYAVSPAVIVSAGLRSFREDQDLRSVGATGALFTDSASFKATSPRFNALWKYERDASAYATVSKGFRSGGFNAVPPPPKYGPEKLWNYEVGNKAALMGGKLQYDVALYYSRYSDVQGLDVPPNSLFATTINTGKASGPGVDLALAAEVSKGLNIDLALGYNDLKYDVDTAERQKGDPLNYIPKLTAALGITSRFVWPGLGMPGMVRADYQHTDSTRVIVRNQKIDVHTDAANYVNLRVGVEQPGWQAYLEGRNLNNFQGVVNPGFGAIVDDVRPAPRSVGFTVRAQF